MSIRNLTGLHIYGKQQKTEFESFPSSQHELSSMEKLGNNGKKLPQNEKWLTKRDILKNLYAYFFFIQWQFIKKNIINMVHFTCYSRYIPNRLESHGLCGKTRHTFNELITETLPFSELLC